MPVRQGSWPATFRQPIGRVLVTVAFEIPSHDAATVRGKGGPLDRLLLTALPVPACVRSRGRDLRKRVVGWKFDADTAAIATFGIGKKHLFGRGKRAGIRRPALSKRTRPVASAISFAFAGIRRRTYRLHRGAGAALLFRQQTLDLRSRIHFGTVFINEKPGKIGARKLA